MTNDVEAAAAAVVARLGRRPIDELEAAVVLEAWGGIEAPKSLAMGPAIVEVTRGRSQTWRKPILKKSTRESGGNDSSSNQAVSSVLMLFSIIIWMISLPSVDGLSLSLFALRIMPIVLGVQWFLKGRYLSSADGLKMLRKLDPISVLLLALALLLSWQVSGVHGELGAALVVVWTAAMLLIVRGWGIAGSVVFVVAAIGGFLDIGTLINVALVTVVMVAATVAAVLSLPNTSIPPGTWDQVAIGTSIGVLFGLLIGAGMNPRAGAILSSSFPVVIFTILGAMLGSSQLNRLWIVTLSSSIDQRSEIPGHSIARRANALIKGAIFRVVGFSSISLPIGLFMTRTEYGLEALWPFIAFILAMVVVVIGTLADAFGEGLWTLAALSAGCLVAVGLRLLGLDAQVSGLALIGGAAVSLAVLVNPVKQMTDDLGMIIATRL